MTIDFIDRRGPDSPRPYSGATIANGFVFVSGRVAPHEPARGIHRGDTPAEEVRGALGVLAEVLEAAGSSLAHVVQMTMLITDPADYDACNAAYGVHFPGGLPARHTVRFGVPTPARVGFACIAVQARPA